jgi:hypothetical protein
MSLNFDFKEMIDRVGQAEFERFTTSPYPATDGEGVKWHPVTNSLIWSSMTLQLGSITEGNVKEWAFRLRMLQLVGGDLPEFSDGDYKVWITEQDIRNHIGMRTNVTTKTREQWLKQQFGKGTEHMLKKLDQPGSAHELVAEHAAKNK